MRGLGRQTLEPWKCTNYQTHCFSASTENTGKSTALREDAQDLYPYTKTNQPKTQVSHAMLEIPSDLFRMTTCRKYLLSKWDSSAGVVAGAHSKTKAGFTSRTMGGQSGKPEAVPPITGGSCPFFPYFKSLLLPAATHTAGFCTAWQSPTFPLSSIPPHMNTATV